MRNINAHAPEIANKGQRNRFNCISCYISRRVEQWEKICFRSLKIFQLNVCTLGKYWFPNFHKDYCSCKKNPSYSIFDKVVMDCNGSQMSELLFPSQCFCICPMSFFFFDKEHQDSIYIRILLLTSEALKLNSRSNISRYIKSS